MLTGRFHFDSLEAATSRLEDIATSTELPKDAMPQLNQSASSPADASAVSTPPPAAAPSAAPKPPSEPLPESLEEFDAFLNSTVDRFIELSNELGGPIAKQVRKVPHDGCAFSWLTVV